MERFGYTKHKTKRKEMFSILGPHKLIEKQYTKLLGREIHRNEVHYRSGNTQVYGEFYHGIIYIANNGCHL